MVSRKMQCPRIETSSTFIIRKKFERANQHFKRRTESFDDYHTCIQKIENACNLFHVNGTGIEPTLTNGVHLTIESIQHKLHISRPQLLGRMDRSII